MNSTVHVILSDDYEVFGHGSGDIDCCLIDPTEKLLKLCGAHEVPVTLFADVAEYWAFEEEEKKRTLQEDYMPATKMRNQMVEAIQSGHDIQLHLHPQWLNYTYDTQNGWEIDEDLWRLPSLPYGDYDNRKSILGSLYQAKKTLEDMLKPYNEDYACIAFRAGDWCIQPESQTLKGLKEIGIRIDSTVAPGFARDDGLTMYDFSEFLAVSKEHAYWHINDTFHKASPEGEGLIEVPILTVPFLFHERLAGRIKRNRLGLLNSPPLCPIVVSTRKPRKKRVNLCTKIMEKIKRRIMVDFTILTADEMYSATQKAARLYQGKYKKIPIVFISHSKILCEENLKELERFIVKAKERGVLFGKYEDILAWEDENRGT